MIFTKPDYYDSFQCVADKCPDTCCAGWQIVIDDESMEKYKKLKSDYIWKVMTAVDWENGCFRQDSAKRCAFLNPDNLCDLYTNAGEESLCKTCREYPRHTEEFENVREITLSASCPIVAHMLLERKTPVTFVTEENPDVEETIDFDDFDPFLYSVIEDARIAMLEILQDRTIPIAERMLLVLGVAHDMQRRINHSDLFSCDKVIEKYKGDKARAYIKSYLKGKDIVEEENLAREIFPLLFELETLREDWDELLHKSQEVLLFSTDNPYGKKKLEFEKFKREHSDVEVQIEQIVVYFLYTYFPGSVYDGQLFAKAQMAVYCTWMIELLWMARWITNKENLSQGEKEELFYRFCREIEHSDKNLEKLDKMMKKKWLL